MPPVRRRKPSTPSTGPTTQPSPPAVEPITPNTSTRAHTEEKDEDIPTTRPLYLFITPVLCLMFLVYLAATTQRRITTMTYASLWTKGQGATPATINQVGKVAVHTLAFEVQDLPGRGKGLIALRDIVPGELLTKEKPLLHGIPVETSSDPAALIRTAVDGLSPAQQTAFFALSHAGLPSNLPAHVYDANLPLAIFETNAVAAGPSIGLFPSMARLNHGCSSAINTIYFWRDVEGVLVTHALRPIKKGEELLTTYINTRQPRSSRRAYLKEHYHFTCACPVCSLPDAASKESDRRLTLMSAHYARLASWGEGLIDSKNAIEEVRQIWTIGEEEGYLSERGQLASDAARVAASASDENATSAWSKLAAEWFGYELGVDSEQVWDALAVAGSPKTHQAWASGKRMMVGGPRTED